MAPAPCATEATQPAAGKGLRARIARLVSSRANARAGLVADGAASIALFAAGLHMPGTHPAGAALAVGSGLLGFSLVEYSFHRWLFHGGRGLAEAGHRRHHDDPHGYDALPFFLPPLGMLALGAALTVMLPAGYALLLASALAAGYAAYGLAHSAIHARAFRGRALARWAANHHVHHRYPQHNFGVTTPLWDIAFGTRHVPVRPGVMPPGHP